MTVTKPPCMYQFELPGILYSTEIFRAIDQAVEGMDELPLEFVNAMFDALDIQRYSDHCYNIFLSTGAPRFEREKIEDFENEHLFYLNLRKRIIASVRMTKTDKQKRKDKERMAYTERKKKATIPGYWRELEAIYSKSSQLSKKTKIPHHVDHIVPLCGMKNGVQVVCGLHAPWNLRIITAEENVKKGSSFDPFFYCDDEYYKANFKKNFPRK